MENACLINSLNENVEHIGKLKSDSIKTMHIIIAIREWFVCWWVFVIRGLDCIMAKYRKAAEQFHKSHLIAILCVNQSDKLLLQNAGRKISKLCRFSSCETFNRFEWILITKVNPTFYRVKICFSHIKKKNFNFFFAPPKKIATYFISGEFSCAICNRCRISYSYFLHSVSGVLLIRHARLPQARRSHFI